MNKFELCYCKLVATLNLLFVDEFSEDFHNKVSYPITEIIFKYMMDNDSEFKENVKEDLDEMIREVFSDETI